MEIKVVSKVRKKSSHTISHLFWWNKTYIHWLYISSADWSHPPQPALVWVMVNHLFTLSPIIKLLYEKTSINSKVQVLHHLQTTATPHNYQCDMSSTKEQGASKFSSSQCNLGPCSWQEDVLSKGSGARNPSYSPLWSCLRAKSIP